MSSITSINRRLVRLTVAAAAVASLAAPAAAVAHPSADVARRAGLAQIKRVAERAAPRGYGSRVNRVGGEVDHRRTAFGGYSVLLSVVSRSLPKVRYVCVRVRPSNPPGVFVRPVGSVRSRVARIPRSVPRAASYSPRAGPGLTVVVMTGLGRSGSGRSWEGAPRLLPATVVASRP
jgi:hypothetical protein